MNHCIHHIPGRLRVRVHSMKGCAQKARAIQSKILAEHGVGSADVNVLTGSLLIRYNPRECEINGLLTLCGVAPKSPNTETCRTLPDQLSEKVLKTVGNYLVELALERATLALLAAIL